MPADSSADTEAAALLRAARGGAEPALGSLLERHRHALVRLARARLAQDLRRKAGASDVVQEAFVQAYRAFPQFRGETETEFTAWLRRILESRVDKLARRYLGTAQRDLRREEGLGDAAGSSSPMLSRMFASPMTSPSGRVEKGDQARRLAGAMARLPETYRRVLMLRHFEGLSFPAIAERIERTVGSVEKLWVRALARLRTVLGEM